MFNCYIKYISRIWVLFIFVKKEFRIYLFIICLVSLVLFLDINFNGIYTWSLKSAKDSVFTTTSLVTTTGFSTADFETFPNISKMCIFFLFFIGGTAGSTTGGIKIIRTLLILKYLSYELKKLIHPQGVYSIKVGDVVVPDSVVKNTLGFYLFYIFIFGLFWTRHGYFLKRICIIYW